MTRTSKVLCAALAAGLVGALYCAWMAAQTSDMRFVACHGEYAVDHAIPECRTPALYGYGIWIALACVVVSAATLAVRSRRQPRASTSVPSPTANPE